MLFQNSAAGPGQSADLDPIVVVGMGCRFPQAPNIAAFWELLLQGKDVIGPVPEDRWDIASLYNADFRALGQIDQREGGFVEDIRAFDPAFFHLSRREAIHMDPQQRLLLECVVQAAENAGLPLAKLRGSRTGVFVGISTHDYNDILQSPSERENLSAYTNQGGSLAIAANRISYVFDLHGPSLAIDTACSSSLYALRDAVLSLREGDCDLAFIGGVNVNLKPEMTIAFSMGNYLSPTSRCRAFSAEADGYVRSEGAGILLLARRSVAERQDLPILAEVVTVTANEDGKTEGMALPNPQAQKALLALALAKSGLRGRDIDYVECHGTGTLAGDPIECRGIGAVYGQERENHRPCLIGSVKTNIGHLEAGSGAAGLIKLVLAMQHGVIPTSLHCQRPSEAIDFAGLGLDVVREAVPWPGESSRDRLAGINSFGFGGANAHAILRRAAAPDSVAPVHPVKAPALIALSGHSKAALAAQAADLLAQAGRHGLANIGFTTLKRRDHYRHRALLIARDEAELNRRIALFVEGETAPGTVQGTVARRMPKVAFVFSGQGPQWHRMGRDLLAADDVFAADVREIDALFRPRLGWSVWDALHREEHEARMDETEIAQPTVFTLQVALGRRLLSLGIPVTAVTGHSLGEMAAAVTAGAITIEDGVDIIWHRSRLHQTASGAGRMLAAALSPEEAETYAAATDGKVSVAAINASDAVVFSGDDRAIHVLAEELTAGGVFNRLLRGKVAFHSYQMDQFKDELLRCLAHLRPRPSTLDFFSSTRGRSVSGAVCGAEYWVECVREPVRFMASIDAMIDAGIDTFIEISPHPVLSASIETLLKARGLQGLVLPTLRRGEHDDVLTFYGTIGRLFCEGIAIEPSIPGRLVPLPNYPFQREILWKESAEGKRIRLGQRAHPHRTSLPTVAEGSLVEILAVDYNPFAHTYLKDHVVQNTLVVPGAAHLDLAFSCRREIYDVSFDRAYFVLGNEDAAQPQGRLQISGYERSLRLQSRAAAAEGTPPDWTTHMRARLSPIGEAFTERAFDVDLLRVGWQAAADIDAFYEGLDAAGLALGGTFRNLRGLWTGRIGSEWVAVARITALPRIAASLGHHVIHGVLLDSCLQSLLFLALEARRQQFAIYVPTSLSEAKVFQAASADLVCISRLRESTTETVSGDLWVYDAAGVPAVGLDPAGLLREVTAGRLAKVAEFHGFASSYLEGSRVDHPLSLIELSGSLVPADRTDQCRHRDAAPLFASLAEVAAALPAGGAGMVPDATFKRYATEVEPILDRMAADIVRRAPAPDITLAPAKAAWWNRLRAAAPTGEETFDAGSLSRRYPDFALEFQLLANCGRIWCDSAGDNLFAADNHTVLRRFYREAFSNRIYNAWAARHLAALIAKKPPGRTLRVLEIGAGTGGLTQALLPELPGQGCAYIYSDVSSSFFAQAREDFSAYPFIEYRVLDLDVDLGAQGIEPGSLDVIVASNVLHASRDLGAALDNIRSALASGGCLLLLEVTNAPPWSDIIFGLADGWWHFDADPSVPRDHASLSPSGWRSLLKSRDFAEVTTSRLPEWDRLVGPAGVAEQTIVLARAGHTPVAEPVLIPAAVIAVVAEPTREAERFVAGLARLGARVSRVDPATPAGDALREAAYSHVLHLAVPTPAEDVERWNADAAMETFHRRSQALRGWSQALLDEAQPPRMRLVLQGRSVMSEALWGCGRVLMSELPRLDVGMVRLDAVPDAVAFEELLREIGQATADDTLECEVSLEGATRRVYRMLRRAETAGTEAAEPRAAPENARYVPGKTGLSEAGIFVAIPRRAPSASELEIEVKATALNFRDVLLANRLMDRGMIWSGLLEDQIGMECAGIVSRKGDEVDGFEVGDRVFACARGAAAKYVTIPALHAARMPAGLSFVEAASLPVAMATAKDALIDRARVQPGETVLIHAATGGVGQAAVQLALLHGAKVLATAGSEEKRQFLLKQGVSAVFNSRDLAFGEEVLRFTRGRGVDIVLNSLSGAAIEQSFRVLAPFGRFVEIGKSDIYDEHRISLYLFRRNISYSAVDVDAALLLKPEWVANALQWISELASAGRISALPIRQFDLTEINAGMQLIARSAHIGKVVLVTPDLADLPVAADYRGQTPVRSDRAYVISGGSGGIGLVLAEWLADYGARHIALLSPSGDAKPEVREVLSNLRARGVQACAFVCDVADEAALSECLATTRREMAPLGGVLHGAMVLDDRDVLDMDRACFERAMRPKALGAMALHRATLADPLDIFVMFSSCSAAFGNPRQANYNAANLFLESLSERRQAEGRPATTVQLGVVGGVGFVARNRHVGQALERVGWRHVHISDILTGVEKAICERPVVRCYADADWLSVANSFVSGRIRRRFERLVRARPGEGEGSGNADSLDTALAHPTTPEAFEIVAEGLHRELTHILASGDALVSSSPITEFGLDSLMFTQLRYWIQSRLKVDVSLMQLMQGPSIEALSRQILGLVADRGEAKLKASEGAWILPGLQRPGARMRLFCFVYMGGAPSQVYGPWRSSIAADVELCPVVLPGSMDRADEEPIEDFARLITTLADALEPYCDKPFAVYGHSQGSLIAFEWLRELHRRGKSGMARHLMVGAYPAPQRPRPFQEVTVLPQSIVDTMPDALERQVDLFGLSDALRQDAAVRKALWPGLRAGFRLGDTYRYMSEPKLSLPITAFAGLHDRAFSVAEVADWKEQTTKTCDFVTCDGSHLFVDTHKAWLVNAINEVMNVEKSGFLAIAANS